MPGLSSSGPFSILAAPIEKIILDNEEKSTTYNETGGTGILLGSIKLPAPKNQCAIAFLMTAAYKIKTDGTLVDIFTRLYDGVIEFDIDTEGYPYSTYTFDRISSIYYSNGATTYSQKGNTQLEVRIYLIGDSGNPSKKVYCRNLVVTVAPVYK